MKILHATKRFKRSYKKLSKSVREDFGEKVEIFLKDPFDVSLRTHKLRGSLGSSHAFCLRNGFRVLVDFLDKNEILLVDIGNHDEYKKWEKN